MQNKKFFDERREVHDTLTSIRKKYDELRNEF